MSKKALLKEFEYYKENQDSLVEKYNGKIIAIKDRSVIGVFDSPLEAIDKTTEKYGYELGTFMVHPCGPGKENYTATFHSPRVTFEGIK